MERRLKRQKHSPRLCPVCRGTVSSAEQLDTFTPPPGAAGAPWIAIAARYTLTVEAVRAANGRSPERPGTLLAGASLIIPAQGEP